MVVSLRIKLSRVDMAEGPVIEIEHAKGNDVTLIPCRCGVQELRKSQRISTDRVWLAVLNGCEPLVVCNFLTRRYAAVGRRHERGNGRRE